MMREREEKTIVFAVSVPEERIIAATKERIIRYRVRQARRRFIFGIVSLPVSVFLSIPALRLLFSEISGSGFFEYIKLIFSDVGSVLPYWRESMTVLAESFPAFGVFALLFVLALFLFSLQSLVIGKNNRRMYFEYSK